LPPLVVPVCFLGELRFAATIFAGDFFGAGFVSVFLGSALDSGFLGSVFFGSPLPKKTHTCLIVISVVL
jgi:hypothetical protein